jgi:DNA-binding transcriptional ArsR family regulator
MKDIIVLNTHDQLKALSDPFRSEIILRLMEKPYTGQQLSVLFNLSRARIHYHLKELEKQNLIEIVKRVEKNGIIQKFYQAVAKGFVPNQSLLPNKKELSETARLMIINMLERSKMKVLSTSEEALTETTGSTDPSDWKYLSKTYEVETTEEKFNKWIKEYTKLIEKLYKLDSDTHQSNIKKYYIHTVGIQSTEDN